LVEQRKMFLHFCRRVFSQSTQFNDFGANAVGTTCVASSNLAGSSRRGRSSVGRAICFGKNLSHRLKAIKSITTMNAELNQKIRWEGILDAMAEFDQQAKPVGLYAPEELGIKAHTRSRSDAEWKEVLAPTLKAMGCRFDRHRWVAPREGRFSFIAPDHLDGYLQVVRLSKVKVRRYGNAYRVDPHHNFSERWQKAGIDSKISALASESRWKSYGFSHRLLLLIGFSTEANPFSNELADLEQDSGWPKKPISYVSRSWPDPHNRKFNTFAALWIYEPTP